MLAMSRLRSAMRWPASMPSAESEARPSEISEMSVLVPPMSNGTRSGMSEQIGAAPGAGNAAGRSRQHRARGQPRGFLDRRHAAMRQDHEQRALESRFGKTLLQIGQIVPHQRPDIGVHDRGRDPLIFLDLRQHVAGAGNADAGQFAREPFGGGDFVHRIDVGMEKADGDRGGAGAADRGDGVIQRALVERRQHLATGLEPLLHAKAQFARHQRFRRRRTQIVAVVLEAFAHFDDVAMALRGQQRDLGAAALQQRIGRNRGAVHDPVGQAQAFPRASGSAAAPVPPARP